MSEASSLKERVRKSARLISPIESLSQARLCLKWQTLRRADAKTQRGVIQIILSLVLRGRVLLAPSQ